MKFLLFICIVLPLMISCSKSKEGSDYNTGNEKIEIKHSSDITLQLDERTADNSKKMQYYFSKSSGEEYICFFNYQTNSVQFYDTDGRLDHEVFCEKEGPNATGQIYSFLYTGKDSLFALNLNTHMVFRLSDKGKLLKTYHLPSWDGSSYFSIPYSATGIEMYLNQNHLYIPSIPGVFYFKNPKEFYSKGKLGIDLNLSNGLSADRIPYPNVALLEGKKLPTDVISARCTANSKENHLIYSFPADHNVYVYSLEGELLETHSLKSKFLDTVNELPDWSKIQDPYKVTEFYLKNTFYAAVMYDKYRDLYYRIVKHGSPRDFNKHQLETEVYINTKYTLIIADSNFNVIDEIELMEGSNHQLVDVSKDGILVVNRTDAKENELKFNQYSVKLVSEK